MEQINNNQSPLEAEPKRKNNKWLYGIITVLIIIVVGLGATLLRGKPKTETLPDSTAAVSDEKAPISQTVDKNQYNWSTMNEGPYNDKISYATSTDLLNWKDSGTTLAEHASVPDALIKDGVIFIYYVDVATNGIPEQIGLIKSSDNGKTWGGRQLIKIEGLGSKVAVDPAPFLLDDGRIRLYYFDISKTKTEGLKNNSMYSAISSDGINFKEEDGVRFKYPGIFDPNVIRVGNVWRMYVGTDSQKVLSATSTDGLTFTYEGVAYSGSAIPNVIYENETYYLFTGGIDISSSKDGKTFTKLKNNFMVQGKITADPGVVKISDNNYLMVYKTKEMKPGNKPQVK